MTVVDAAPFIQHVLRLLGLRVVCAVLVYIGTNIGQQIGSVTSLLQSAAQPVEVASVCGELLA